MYIYVYVYVYTYISSGAKRASPAEHMDSSEALVSESIV